MRSLALLLPFAIACATASEPTAESQSPITAVGSDGAILDHARVTMANQHARGAVAFPASSARATLIVDLETSCYPFDKWQTEPPPPGQRWPASCDAFDRSFEISLLGDNGGENGPAIELVHAATPFGGPLHVEADVTDVANALAGTTRTLDAYISTMSDAAGQVSGSNGGWNVSARIAFEPGPAPRDVIAVIPLVDAPITTAVTSYDFELPAGTTSARLEYTATGHGGGPDPSCLGPAEEFCHRAHTLTIDGAPLANVDPWRTDCAQLCTMVDGGPFGRYCRENPCGSPASVRAPRANWCPGSVTTPAEITPSGLAPGHHTVGLAIDRIAPHGSWRVAAKLFAYR